MEITEALLKKYHQGHCSADEKGAVEEWLENTDGAQLEQNPFAEKKFDDKKELIWAKMSQQAPGLNDPIMHQARSSFYRRVIGYAAMFLLISAATFSVYYVSITDNLFNSKEVSEGYQTVKTQRGEKRTVTLSDGSTIRMNYETEIKAPEKFEGNQRVVYLTGHAHFDVARDTERPFIIYTEDSKTQVLGTSFDINTKEEGATEIIVTSGKVAFSEKDKASNLVTLKLNDRAVLGADKKIATDEVDALSMTAWKDNRLVFNGETLKEVIKVLEPWYDVTILVQDSDLLTKDFKWSGDNPPLETVIRELSFAGQFEYRIKEKTVSIF